MERIINGTKVLTVNTYSDLPDPARFYDSFYYVLNGTTQKELYGDWGEDFYPKGLYYSNGILWEYKEIPIPLTEQDIEDGNTESQYLSEESLSSIDLDVFQNEGPDKYVKESDLNSLVPYNGATQNVDISGFALDNTRYVLFDSTETESPIPNQKGLLYYNSVKDILVFQDSEADTSVEIGQELLVRCRNNTGSTIVNGSVVYISGVIGQNPTIALAQADTLDSSRLIGVVTHDIANNTLGKVCVFGTVNNINTSDFNDGDEVYLSANIAGGLTTTPPSNFVSYIGVVEYAHPVQGKLLVRPQKTLGNSNSLGTSQIIPPTQNAVKSYVDTGLSEKLSNLVADYTNATTPLNIDDKAIVFQGGTPKLVNVSELGGNEYFYVSFNGFIQFTQAPTSWFGRPIGPQNVGWHTANANTHTQNIGTNPLLIDVRSSAISFPFNCVLEDVEIVIQTINAIRSVRVNFNVYTLSGGSAVNTRNILQIATDSTQKKLTNSDYTIPNITINKGERITSVVNQITNDTGAATNWDFVLKFKKV